MTRPRVIAAGKTDVGRKRAQNQDNYTVIEESNLFVVADGMGGHASGEIASQLAVETLKEFFRATEADPEATWPFKMDKSRGYEENRLITSIKLANLRIFEAQRQDPRLQGMGTTVAGLLVIEEGILIAHVGDSRIYRYRNEKLEQLTEDHSLLNDYIKMKRLTEEEIANFPHKHVIVRALGMRETVKVDTSLDKPQPGDIYVICSDGLSGPATDEEIRAIIQLEGKDIQGACVKLVERANENGGPDNVTVVLAKVLEAN